MRLGHRAAAAAICLFASSLAAVPAFAEKQGGILRMYHRDSPASASIHEEATYSNNVPFMPVFNNLVLYKQDVKQNSLQSIVPELATDWAWSADNTKLTFNLRGGVKWHDGKPFTARDVVCTFDMLMDKAAAKFRKNPRKTWYDNVAEVTANGDAQVVFSLKRPQPALIALLASGYTPIYPCHVSPSDMRTHPIGTGPFKFVSFKQNESITLTRSPDYCGTKPAPSAAKAAMRQSSGRPSRPDAPRAVAMAGVRRAKCGPPCQPGHDTSAATAAATASASQA